MSVTDAAPVMGNKAEFTEIVTFNRTELSLTFHMKTSGLQYLITYKN